LLSSEDHVSESEEYALTGEAVAERWQSDAENGLSDEVAA
jgi:hypothetical protein